MRLIVSVVVVCLTLDSKYICHILTNSYFLPLTFQITAICGEGEPAKAELMMLRKPAARKPAARSRGVYSLFWRWLKSVIAKSFQNPLGLPASPAGCPEQESEPWWCWLDLHHVQRCRAQILMARRIFTLRLGVTLLSATFHTAIFNSQCFNEERKRPAVSFLWWNNPKSPQTAEQTNRRWLMLTLRLQTRIPQC